MRDVNKHNTYPWFRERVYKLEDQQHDATDYNAALARANEDWSQSIPIGCFYKVDRPTYDDEEPALANGPLIKQPLVPKDAAGIIKGLY